MSNKIQYTAGFLTILILLSGVIYITLNETVRLRVDEDKSTFYVKNDNNRWIVSGREYNSLFDGNSKMKRDLSNTEVTHKLSDYEFIAIRTTKYQRGPVVKDIYYFQTHTDDVTLFPVSHTVEIINGTGFFYRYEVRNLDYDGESLNLNSTSMDFGLNMKVEWDEGYRWAKVYKSGILKVQYDIKSDREIFNVRLFDPPIGPGNYCYQETANKTSICGGVNTGNYDNRGSFLGSFPASNAYDEDYSTFAIATNSQSGEVFINYTKPPESINGTIWQISIEDLITVNRTIPESCWDYDTERLVLKMNTTNNGALDLPARADCYNGSTWVNLYNTSTGALYEEAIYWAKSNFSFTFNNISDNVKAELGSLINISVNTSNEEDIVCIDVDHPQGGINVSCGENSTSYELNITFFREDNFTSRSSSENVSLFSGTGFIINDTIISKNALTGGFLDFNNVTDNDYDTFSNVNASLYQTIPDNTEIVIANLSYRISDISDPTETLIDFKYKKNDGSISRVNQTVSEKCIQVAKNNSNILELRYAIGTVVIDPINLSTLVLECKSNSGFTSVFSDTYSNRSNVAVYDQRVLEYESGVRVKSHKFDEPLNLSFNLTVYTNNTAINNVGLYLGSELVRSFDSLAPIDNLTLSTFNDSSTLKSVKFPSTGEVIRLGTIKIPKDATIQGTTLDLTPVNVTSVESVATSSQYQWTKSDSVFVDARNANEADDGQELATTTFNQDMVIAGQDSSTLDFTLKRLGLSFDTDFISTDADLSSFSIDLRRVRNVPLVSLIDGTLTIMKGNFSNNIGLDDYSNFDRDIVFAQATFSGPNPVPGLVSLTFNTTEIINTSGFSKFHIHETDRDFDNVAPVGQIDYGVAFAETGSDKLAELNFTQVDYPHDVFLEIGSIDGNREFSQSGIFNESTTVSGFNTTIQDFLSTCTADANGDCDVPIFIYSSTIGNITLDSIQINYTIDYNPIIINKTILENYLSTQDNISAIPIVIIKSDEVTGDTIQFDLTLYDHVGGNETIDVLFHNDDYTSNLTRTINYYHSGWNFTLPNNIDFLEFIPRTPTTQDVPAYGQTSISPIINITMRNYGNDTADFYIIVNETLDCTDVYVNNNSNISNSTQLQSDWINTESNLAESGNTKIWLWTDYNCSFTNWLLFNPSISLRACCSNCDICDEDLG